MMFFVTMLIRDHPPEFVECESRNDASSLPFSDCVVLEFSDNVE